MWHFEYQWTLIETQRETEALIRKILGGVASHFCFSVFRGGYLGHAGRWPSLRGAHFQCVDFVTCSGAELMHDFPYGDV